MNQADEAKAVKLSAQDAREYLQGTRLAFIVVALVLGIFLASLDVVGDYWHSI